MSSHCTSTAGSSGCLSCFAILPSSCPTKCSQTAAAASSKVWHAWHAELRCLWPGLSLSLFAGLRFTPPKSILSTCPHYALCVAPSPLPPAQLCRRSLFQQLRCRVAQVHHRCWHPRPCIHDQTSLSQRGLGFGSFLAVREGYKVQQGQGDCFSCARAQLVRIDVLHHAPDYIWFASCSPQGIDELICLSGTKFRPRARACG